jgi:hypothetical protein
MSRCSPRSCATAAASAHPTQAGTRPRQSHAAVCGLSLPVPVFFYAIEIEGQSSATGRQAEIPPHEPRPGARRGRLRRPGPVRWVPLAALLPLTRCHASPPRRRVWPGSQSAASHREGHVPALVLATCAAGLVANPFTGRALAEGAEPRALRPDAHQQHPRPPEATSVGPAADAVGSMLCPPIRPWSRRLSRPRPSVPAARPSRPTMADERWRPAGGQAAGTSYVVTGEAGAGTGRLGGGWSPGCGRLRRSRCPAGRSPG